jgi:molecular chaperone HtpG
MSQTAQTMEFRTELKQLLDIIVHSLYTKKEIFLRELISNAADAIDKLRFEALTQPDLAGGETSWKIELIADEAAGTLTVRDNGIGMTSEEVVENLGTIARSGTKQFIEALKASNAQNRPELIGQFGVGFYASFMAADKVTVITRSARSGDSEAVKWESDGQGSFSIEPTTRAARGTDIILHLREDSKEFLQQYRLRSIVKQYSDFIEHPIVMEVEKEKDGKKEKEEQTLNSRKAIWLKSKSEVKQEEYDEFYKQISYDFEPPASTIHMAAEGAMEFKALLFVPAKKPMDFYWREPKSSVQLYVRRVLIQHDCEQLLPTWLRFVKGVVDSSDLPLNVSRETLQHNAIMTRIRSNLVNRVLKTLEEIRTTDAAKYEAFYDEFGTVLKEGVTSDFENRKRIADLLLFQSTRTEAGKTTTLADYVKNMPAEQKEIYFLTGETREQLAASPYVEAFKAKNQEVLLLTDPMDEFVVSSLNEYDGKPLKAADRGKAEEEPESLKQAAEKMKDLLAAVKEKLPTLKEVRLTSRLKESAACLVADENAPSAYMERLLKRAGRSAEAPPIQRILELNPEHPLVQGMQRLHDADKADPRVAQLAEILYDQAVIAEGSRVQDPAAFARRINDLLVKAV